MSIVSDAVNGLVNGVLASPLLTRIADLIPDPVERAKQLEETRQQLIDAALKSDLAQLAVNQAEATNANLFTSGWRPAIGWLCGAIFAYKYVLQPFLIFLLVAAHTNFDYHNLPNLDSSEMTPILLGMLGLAGAHVYENVKGV